MSVVYYTGRGDPTVVLPDAWVTSFRQEGVYDNVGGVDFILQKFDIVIQSVVNNNFKDLLGKAITATNAPVGVDMTNPANLMKYVRLLLLKPRKKLSIKINGVELIPIQADNFDDSINIEGTNATVPGTVDAKNGPVPKYCEITDMGNETFLITWAITAHYWEENTLNGVDFAPVNRVNPVLFNRWTETIDMDSCCYTIRTREGVFSIRSDNFRGQVPDNFRLQMAVLAVPHGFLRQSSQYVQSPDGLTLKYRIVDKEVFRMPPGSSFEAEGQYIEATPRLGAIRKATCRVLLRGAKPTNATVSETAATQAGLLRLALRVVVNHLQSNGFFFTNVQLGILGRNNRPLAILEYGTIRCDLYKNEVEVDYTASLPARRTDASVTMMAAAPVGSLNPQIPPSYPIRGSTGLLLQAAAYFDPNIAINQLNRDTGQMTQGLVPGEAGRTRETS